MTFAYPAETRYDRIHSSCRYQSECGRFERRKADEIGSPLVSDWLFESESLFQWVSVSSYHAGGYQRLSPIDSVKYFGTTTDGAWQWLDKMSISQRRLPNGIATRPYEWKTACLIASVRVRLGYRLHLI